MDTLLRTAGENIRRYRKRIGWSQERLASECGLHRTYIGGIERGERNFSLNNLARIASALGVPPHELLIKSDDTDRE